MKNVLVIGSTGQIGSELTMKLRNMIPDGNIVAGYIPGAEPKGVLLESGPAAEANVKNAQQLADIVEKYKIDTSVVKFFISIKSVLCISAHSANTIKDNCITALGFLIKLIPFGSINLCSCKGFFNNYRFGVSLFDISNLSFNPCFKSDVSGFSKNRSPVDFKFGL